MDDVKDDPKLVLALAANELGAGDFDEALARIRKIQPDLLDNPGLLAPSRALEARALASLGRGQEALSVLDVALADAQKAGLEEHVKGLGGMRERLEQAVEMRNLAVASVSDIERQAPDAATRAVLLSNKIMAVLASGDIAEAKRILPRARMAAEEAEEPGALLPVLLSTAQLCVATDDAKSAQRALEAARTLAQQYEPDALPLIEEMTGYLLQNPDA